MSAFENAVIAELRTGTIVSHSLAALGVCEMQVRVGGHTVTVTWYGSMRGAERTILIDGKDYPSSHSAITRAAKKRAKTLIYEQMAELDRSVL